MEYIALNFVPLAGQCRSDLTDNWKWLFPIVCHSLTQIYTCTYKQTHTHQTLRQCTCSYHINVNTCTHILYITHIYLPHIYVHMYEQTHTHIFTNIIYLLHTYLTYPYSHTHINMCSYHTYINAHIHTCDIHTNHTNIHTHFAKNKSLHKWN